MPRTLILEPGEKCIFAGHVIENPGEVQISMLVSDSAPFIREREIIKLEDATSPALKVYYAIMCMCAEGDDGFLRWKDEFKRFARDLVGAAPGAKDILTAIGGYLTEGDYRSALDGAFALLAYEEKAISSVAGGK